MERKLFMKVLGATLATGSFITFIESCQKNGSAPSAPSADFTLDLSSSSNAALLNSGGSLVSNQVMIINDNGNYIALSDICTHQGCSLGYSSSVKQLQCPCHGGIFSLSGSVISGPPPSSLKSYTVSRNGNILHITG